MAIVRTDDKHYKAIADTLRNKGLADNTFTPQEIPQAISNCCDGFYSVGMSVGYDNGVEEGITQGKKSAYDEFWDAFQENGNRTAYNNAFGPQWTTELFKPKYPMRPKIAYMMFFSNTSEKLVIPDFVEYCKENNIILDFSNTEGSALYALAGLNTNHFGVLDFSCSGDTSKTVSLGSLFYSHNYSSGIKVIDEFICSERTIFVNDTFQRATYLEEVTFSGVIASDNFNVSYCPKLTHDSLMSIIYTLKSYTGTTTTKTCTLGTTHLNNLTETEKAIATQKGWSLV